MNIAINGLGRIGRQFYKICLERDNAITAVNDLCDKETLLYLLNFDSVYGCPREEVSLPKIFLNEKDPLKLPWKKSAVDLVVECAGIFTKKEEAEKHLAAGAKKVVISANSPSADLNIVMGVNHRQYDPKKHHIIAGCSCTTNAASPAMKVLDDVFKIEKASIATVHSYTASQGLVDSPKKDWRDGRAAGQNIVPSETGAAKAVMYVLPKLQGKLDGVAYRVPTASGSIVEVTALLKKRTTAEKINAAFVEASQGGEMLGILEVTDQPLVSHDILGPISCMVDLNLTRVVGGNLASVKVWYDNEWGYAERLADLVSYIFSSS